MKIKKLHLHNFCGFTDTTIEFPDENIVVLIGKNGTGKSTILNAIAKLLSELSYRYNGDKRQHISAEEIRSGADSAECKLTLSAQNQDLSWTFKRKADINSQPVVIYPSNKDVFVNQVKSLFGQPNPNQKKPLFLDFNSDYKPNVLDFIDWYKEMVLFESFLKTNGNKTHHTSIKAAIELAIYKFTGISISPKVDDDFKSVKPVFLKNNLPLNFANLSDGEQRIIDIIGRIVSHFIVSFNSDKITLLDFEGIVLIDEIEKHLHPQWQREIVPNLQTTFPNLQFIITTHSPQVVSNLLHHNILFIENFEIRTEVPHTLGRDANSVLYDLFEVTKRSVEYQNKIDSVYGLIDEQKIDKAKKRLEDLKTAMGDNDTEIKRIEMQIDLMD